MSTALHSSRPALPRSILNTQVVAAYGPGVTGAAIGKRFGISSDAVKGIWRRAREAGVIGAATPGFVPDLSAEVPVDLIEIALRMFPGRRRMLLTLLAAAADGVTMADLTVAYYGDGVPPLRARASCSSQLARMRDQLGPLDWQIIRMGAPGRPDRRFVLSRKAIPLPPAPSPEPTRYPLADKLGIKVTSCMVGGSAIRLARCVGLEGVMA